MADVRPLRALRYDPARVDPALAIAPPYDVISPALQAELYARSPHNIIRIEFGEQSPGDTPADSRYTRAAADLGAWRAAGVLTRTDPLSMYIYDLRFEWDGEPYSRKHVFGLVRLEEWDKGVVKPHEHTLSGPKQDRLELLRATRTQVSPVYCLYRRRSSGPAFIGSDIVPYDFEADGQRHVLSSVIHEPEIAGLHDTLANSDFYIADGHHRYETALAYRNECRDAAPNWTGDEPENFVLMAMTDASDPSLLVLPTHRLVHRPLNTGAIDRLLTVFEVEDVGPLSGSAVGQSEKDSTDVTVFVALGLEPGRAHKLTLRDRAAAEASMPPEESAPWKRLDVNVLQYAILQSVFGIDDGALKAGGAVTYIQSPEEAARAVSEGNAAAAFLLNATPVDQIIAVSDVNGRMPQKSTYFYPKLPTGLILYPFD
jgi:uncharacterized protein (DUF1015 family)